MPLFESETPQVILSRILGRMEHSLQTREGSYSYDVAAPVSFEIWRVLMTLDELIHAFYVDETSGPWLDKHADLFAMSRRVGTRAYAEIYLTGKEGTVVPAGTVFLTESGLKYSLVYAVTIAAGETTGYLQSADVGEIYNADAGEISRIGVTISGLEDWESGPATGGTDPESDASLFARIDQRRKRPGNSGNPYHYEEWALECDGVGAVKVDGCFYGPGTVRVLIVGYEREALDQDVVDAVKAHIEEERPVGADVTVLSAKGTPIDVQAKLYLAKGADLEAVKAEFVSKLDTYLKELSFRRYKVFTNRVAAKLLEVDSVIDYEWVTLNGSEENVVLADDQIPEVGEVTLA